MVENEMSAVIAQHRKTLEILTASDGPLSDEAKREVHLGVTMLTTAVSHRGPDYEFTREQALELAAVLHEHRELAEARGFPEPSFEESYQGPSSFSPCRGP